MPSSATNPPKRLPTLSTWSSGSVISRPSHRRAPQRACGVPESCTRPTIPFGATMTKATSSSADDQHVDRRRDRHGRDLLDGAEQDRADQRADPARGAADHRHRDRVDRVFEPEGRRGLEIADVVGERRAGHAHQRAGERRRDQLQPQRRHAAGFGRQFVVADGGEADSRAASARSCARCDRDDRRAPASAGTGTRCRSGARTMAIGRADHVGAARAADIVPVDDQRLQHDGERERRDGEEEPRSRSVR